MRFARTLRPVPVRTGARPWTVHEFLTGLLTGVTVAFVAFLLTFVAGLLAGFVLHALRSAFGEGAMPSSSAAQILSAALFLAVFATAFVTVLRDAARAGRSDRVCGIVLVMLGLVAVTIPSAVDWIATGGAPPAAPTGPVVVTVPIGPAAPVAPK